MNSPQVTPSSARRQISKDDCVQLRRDIQGLSKREVVEVLRLYLPHKSPSWIRRHFDKLTKTSPSELAVWLSYPDPTGEKAVHNVMRGGGRG